MLLVGDAKHDRLVVTEAEPTVYSVDQIWLVGLSVHRKFNVHVGVACLEMYNPLLSSYF